METDLYVNDLGLMSVPDFYKGKTVFITGFTGYLGKLLVEKLLYSCPDIYKIYVLIRTKKGTSPMDRCKNTLNSKAFDRLKKQFPGILESKVIPIAGDVMEENLGISEDDQDIIRDEVNIVFHVAASVRFDDPLDLAFKQNTCGTKKIVDLALTMNKLECLVYVSTAYTNCDNHYIEEKLYPPKMDWRDALKVNENIDPVILQLLSKKVTGTLPNTYVFTKSLSEHIINDHRDRLPVVIARPSIIISSIKEPCEGWLDTFNGPIALMMATLLGFLRCNWVEKEAKCNYIYSDVVINGIILAGWKTAQLNSRSKIVSNSVTIYNICAPEDFMYTHKEFLGLMLQLTTSTKDGKMEKVPYIDYHSYSDEFEFKINNLYRHVLPALIIDFILKLAGVTPILLKVRRKVYTSVDLALYYFTHNTFTFQIDNFWNLVNDLTPKDRENFLIRYDKDKLKQIAYSTLQVVKHTILKPYYDELETNLKRQRLLYIVDRSCVYLTYSLLIMIVYYSNIHCTIASKLLSFLVLPS